MSTAALDVAHGEQTADSAALKRIAAGEVNALAGIYDRHAGALMKFALRLVGRHDAEDLLQATFMRAVGIAGSYQPRGPTARSWLMGIMAKLMQERRRSLARFARAVGRFQRGARTSETPQTAERLAVERALQRLASPKRIVLVLAEIEGYTCEQIAEMLSIPIGTVWTRLHRGRKELRALYEGESG